MKLAVDAELSTDHGRCWTVSRGLFTADAEGFNAPRVTEFEVPEGREDAARLSVRGCPEGAIIEIE